MASINAEPFIRRLAEYACNENASRPWPNSTITVSHVISRNTNLMAVIWKEIDDRMQDNATDEAGDLSRVVFTLTVCSTILKHVSRMTEYLCNIVPYNAEFLWNRDFAGDEFEAVGGQNRRLIGYDPALPPELQQLTLVTKAATTPEPLSYTVEMSSCTNEGHNIDYNAGLDIWQGECLFVATMTNANEEDDD